MNKDEIIKLIEDNGLTLHGDIEHFAALVEAAEREACAKVCEEYANDSRTGATCAEVIRARGQA
jgi:hypothetical protein